MIMLTPMPIILIVTMIIILIIIIIIVSVPSVSGFTEHTQKSNIKKNKNIPNWPRKQNTCMYASMFFSLEEQNANPCFILYNGNLGGEITWNQPQVQLISKLILSFCRVVIIEKYYTKWQL